MLAQHVNKILQCQLGLQNIALLPFLPILGIMGLVGRLK